MFNHENKYSHLEYIVKEEIFHFIFSIDEYSIPFLPEYDFKNKILIYVH